MIKKIRTDTKILRVICDCVLIEYSKCSVLLDPYLHNSLIFGNTRNKETTKVYNLFGFRKIMCNRKICYLSSGDEEPIEITRFLRRLPSPRLPSPVCEFKSGFACRNYLVRKINAGLSKKISVDLYRLLFRLREMRSKLYNIEGAMYDPGDRYDFPYLVIIVESLKISFRGFCKDDTEFKALWSIALEVVNKGFLREFNISYRIGILPHVVTNSDKAFNVVVAFLCNEIKCIYQKAKHVYESRVTVDSDIEYHKNIKNTGDFYARCRKFTEKVKLLI